MQGVFSGWQGIDVSESRAMSFNHAHHRNFRPCYGSEFELSKPLTASIYKEKLHNQITQFANVRRMYKFLIRVFEEFNGQRVNNDLLYSMLYLAVDGLFLRFTNYSKQLIDFLNFVASNYLSEIKRNRTKEISKSEIFVGPGRDFLGEVRRETISAEISKFVDSYDRFFPGVKDRNRGYPNRADMQEHVKKLREVMKPIMNHRDKSVAHWDKNAVRATFEELSEAFEHVENLLSNLLFCSFWTSQSVNILGGSDIDKTAKLFCAEMLHDERHTTK